MAYTGSSATEMNQTSASEALSVTAEPLSGDGSWGTSLICRILGNDTDCMFQSHEQEKRLTI